ncbi:MAG: hypothetical protein A4S17_11505 [Proteobacteria bacterium HN_bin10]|nr:MAG: hypothetical protein A4S17_11505 [Proteobacteria bacterium HN_bin10]
MRKVVLNVTLCLALFAAAPAFADGPLPASLRSAGVTQEQWGTLQGQVRHAAARASVSELALAAVAERLGLALAEGGRQVLVTDILGQLDALATRIAELEVRFNSIARDEDPEVATLVAQAQVAIGAADLDASVAPLAEARRLRAERNAQLRARLEAGQRDEAVIAGVQGGVALLRADYLGAAAQFEEAAQLSPEDAWAWRNQAVWALQTSLSVRSRTADPAGWAQTMLALSSAYNSQGRVNDARVAMNAAIEGFEQVGDAVMAEQTRALLRRLLAN